ncbi:hypothetical protein WJX74_008793 [Apatococcus lobatus]|uniref:Spermidine synthase n=2 Tax=Apatococcus TaxID=904362 RepID=A0AAW1RJX4_9CHLO
MQTPNHDVMVLEDPGWVRPVADPRWHPGMIARLLMLSTQGGLHSIFFPNELSRVLTGEYWDWLAAATATFPEGPIGIYGLGGGTVVRIIHNYWPHRKMKAWELDAIVLSISKDYFGLQDLVDSGILDLEIADALQPDASIDDGFAGIVVDLFTSTVVLPELYEEQTWRDIRSRLRPGGRIVTNLGDMGLAANDPTTRAWKAMQAAFEGAVLASERLYMTRDEALVALSGPEPATWELPEPLKHCGQGWLLAADFTNAISTPD